MKRRHAVGSENTELTAPAAGACVCSGCGARKSAGAPVLHRGTVLFCTDCVARFLRVLRRAIPGPDGVQRGEEVR